MALYERLGAPPEKVASGVDLNGVLQWIGTYEELIDKVDRDNKPFDRERATLEVDKILMDPTLVASYIKVEKDKPRSKQAMLDAERENLQDPGTILTYAFWIFGFSALTYFQKRQNFNEEAEKVMLNSIV
eukprot:CAMPEP_0194179348 /NCGR_PEP_ID=MMETSP0154-20130528/12826_1 /TAXON_ID=1049557 /ORGANISM="Thalassiothrix antarctica, Strain L6-D1" /LENGTH=129 /DNA_ID=CAMNT_0038894675 /DNA_START=98 /DNA_END=483 /DNA_ORIENTATION=-